ncbi:MAG: hypothetical protein EOM87_04775, partial [Clostridia bacterium]|nr:hypothetical protein [Clostridia bacterium]
MKKLCAALIILILMVIATGCNFIRPRRYPPEEILPVVYVSGDVESALSLNVTELEKSNFGALEGYTISAILDNAS